MLHFIPDMYNSMRAEDVDLKKRFEGKKDLFFLWPLRQFIKVFCQI